MTASIRRPQPAEQEDKYPALQIVLLLWKGIIIVWSIAVVVSAIQMWSSAYPNKVALGLLILLGGGVVALVQWAWTEIVQVIMDIEENTRRAADRRDT